MDAEDLKKRTKQFSLQVIAATEALPSTRTATVIARQLLRSGTSVGANYRAACRARSRPDFISNVGIAVEEVDESLYWMEMLVEAQVLPRDRLAALMKEAEEILAILTASAKTARTHLKSRVSP